MSILLLYNSETSLSWEQLKERTGLEQTQIIGPMQVLVKARLLLAKTKDGMSASEEQIGTPDTMYSLNEDYKSKKIRVNLNVPIRAEQKREADETLKNVDEDRNLMIQAAIVRIMKARKQLKHVVLVDEVISQISSRFQPSIVDIKKSIEVLLEKDYIERKSGEKDVYNYVA